MKSTSPRRIPPQVVLLGLAALLNDVSSDMIYPLLPLFLASQLGVAPFAIGIIEGLADALSAILKYYSGRVSDRLSVRKPLVVGGYGVAAASRLILVVASTWIHVLFVRLLDRAGKGIRTAPRDALIAGVTPEEHRGRAFGFHRALDHTGAVIGPLAAAALIALGLTFRSVFLIAVIPAAAGVILLLTRLREEPREISRHTVESQQSSVRLPRHYWKALLPVLFFYLANSSDLFLLLWALEAGLDTALIPLLWAAHHAVKALLSTHGGILSDRIGRRVSLAAGWLSYAAIYLLFPFAETRTAFLVLFILYAVPFALAEGPERAWIAGHLPPDVQGRGLGFYAMSSGLSTLAGTALFGLLYQELSPIFAFHAGAGFAIIATLLLARSPSQPPGVSGISGARAIV